MRNYKEIPLWANISPEKWNDWKWQLDNRIMYVCRDYSHRLCCSGNFTPEGNTRVKEMLKKYQPLYINTHFNHPKEITSTGNKAKIAYFSSVGDFNYLGSRAKLPTYIFGPQGRNYHSPDEYVELNTIVKTAEVIYDFLKKVLI